MVARTRVTLVRHIAAQEDRIARQDIKIERLRSKGVPLDEALGLLATMLAALKDLRIALTRLPN